MGDRTARTGRGRARGQRGAAAAVVASDPIATSNAARLASLTGPAAPGVAAIEDRAGLPGGRGLDAATQAHFEARFGTGLGAVRVHTDAAADRAAREQRAAAFTVGADVVFAAGQYAPTTPRGRALLAHELAHVIQARAVGTRRREASGPDDASEREAERVAAGLTSKITARPTARIHRAPPTERAPVVIARELESEDAGTRTAAIAELGGQTGPAAWSTMLRAQMSRFADVRAGAERAVRAWDRAPGFRAFLQAQADAPVGLVSDMAIVALRLLGGRGPADVDNYRMVIRQRLDLATSWLTQFEVEFADVRARVPTSPTGPALGSPLTDGWLPSKLATEVEALRQDARAAPLDRLVDIGARASLLLERVGALGPIITALKGQTAQLKQPSDLKLFVDARLMTLLSKVGGVTSEIVDPAMTALSEDVAAWPTDLAVELARGVHAQFTAAQAEMRAALATKPLPSFRRAWGEFKTRLLEPILARVDGLVVEAAKLEKRATLDPQGALDGIRDLGPEIDELGVRVQAVLAAIQMQDAYTDLALTDEAAKDVFESTELGLKWHFAAFAEIANDTAHTNEERSTAFNDLVTGPALTKIEADIKSWHEIQEGEFRFAMLLAEVGAIVLSCYAGGIAGGLVRGLLGRGVSLGGRLLIGSAVLGAETLAFTMTNRLLHVPFGGKLIDASLPGELAQNAVLFGLLKGSGAVYERMIAPKLPKALVGAGRATLTFSLFQAWTVGLHAWETGEWLGLGDARFWKSAAQNAVFLGAVHLGMGIAKPVFAPVTNRVAMLAIERHNARCAKLGESIRAWQGEAALDLDVALDLARRSRALYLERLDLLKSIHAADPTQLTKDELAAAERVLREQVAAVDEVIFQGGARMVPHDTLPDVFYYDGDAAKVRDHYEGKGFEVLEFDAETGRMRVKDPAGNVLELLRSRLGETGAGTRPTSAEAETIYERIRGATGDTAAVARNTGIPEGALRRIRQHVFMKKHRLFDPAQGKEVERRFDADENIAYLWQEAMRRKLGPEELAEFRRLMAHEFVEAALMRSGMPYRAADSWVQQPDGSWVSQPSSGGAHDLAPHVDPNRPAFGHYDALKVPMAKAGKLPLQPWMGIPPEDLIAITEPQLTAALGAILSTHGLDLTRKLTALAARGGGDAALSGTIMRIAELPVPEGAKQAQALLDAWAAKPEVPAAPERGEPFKRGGTAQLYDMAGHPDLLVKPAGGRISREAQAMADLESLGIPTPYVARQDVQGTPSIILQKIDGEGSKDMVGTSAKPKRVADAAHTELVTQKTIDDLHAIRDILTRNKVNVADFQFIVRRSDGAVFVNDPTGLTFDSKPSPNFDAIVAKFEAILRAKAKATP